MQNEFEKKLKQEMETFSIQPNQKVWKEVELAISKEKRKRRLIFAWIFIGLLLSGGAYISYNNLNINGSGIETAQNFSAIKEKNIENNNLKINNNKQLNKKEIKNSSIDQKINNSSVDIEKRLNGDEFSNDIKITEKQSVTIQKSSSKYIAPNNIAQVINQSTNNLWNKKKGLFNATDTVNNSKIINSITSLQLENQHKNNSIVFNNNEVRNATDTFVKVETDNLANVSDPKDTLANPHLTAAVLKKDIKKSNWKFGFLGSLGISNNLRSSSPMIRNALQNSVVAVNPATFSQSPGLGLKYNNAFSLGIGLFAERRITNKFSLSIGFNYHYYGAQINVAGQMDSTFTLYDASLNTTSRISTYYTSGFDSKYLNKYHLFHLPINLKWNLNGNKKSAINAFAGISPSVLAGSNALYQNQNNSLIYKEEKQFNRFNLFIQGGLLFQVKHNIQLGPVVHYSITNFSKSSTNTNQNLIFTGITGSYTLK